MSQQIKPQVPFINWNHPLTKGLVTASVFFEKGSTTTLDVAGRLAETINGATWNKSLPGTVLSFRGVVTTDYVTVKSGAILSGLKNLTIFAKINPNQLPSAGVTGSWTIYGERASSGNDILKLELGNAGVGGSSVGALRLVYRDDAGTLNRFGTGTTVPSINVWHDVALVKLGTTVNFYIDGVFISTNTLTASDTFTNANIQSRIAGDVADSLGNFPGLISEVLLWTRGLNSQEIKDLYSNPWLMYSQPNLLNSYNRL